MNPVYEMPPEEIAADGPFTLAQYLEKLGDEDPARILWTPRPGTATEDDFVKVNHKLVELIDGTVVHKTVGMPESSLAMLIACRLGDWNHTTNAGVVSIVTCPFWLAPGLIRLPDASFTAWRSLPTPDAHLRDYAQFPPDLAVEVLSLSDRPRAFARKVRDYFTYGTRQVWVADPRAETVVVYTAPGESTTLSRNDTLDGGKVLPGFTLPLAELFDAPELNPRPLLGA